MVITVITFIIKNSIIIKVYRANTTVIYYLIFTTPGDK